MSTFTVEVVRVEVEPHPNADMIEVAKVKLYQSVIKKGQFKTGDLAVYIPEGALLPENLLKGMGFWDEGKAQGTLAGSKGNRVKAVKLRGVVSQGILLSCKRAWACEPPQVGEDVAESLGITKYAPPVPSSFQGKVAWGGATIPSLPHWDVENLKKYGTDCLVGKHIRVTEKIHGTFCAIGALAEERDAELYQGRAWTASKGFYNRKQVFNPNTDESIYTQAAKRCNLLDLIQELGGGKDTVLMGEIFGKGVQDLHYNYKTPQFLAFGHLVHEPGKGWVEGISLPWLPHVPILYEGPFFGLDHLKALAEEDSHFGEGLIREGIVIESEGNPRLKLISDRYLFRKGTQTEFE